MNKYYYLYQITNLVNGKIYVGVHKTDNLDDNYMGSGKLIVSAEKKYGLENFEKTILIFFDNEDDMYEKEAEIVNHDFILREDTYNLVDGGNRCGSMFGHLGGTATHKKCQEDSDFKALYVEKIKEGRKDYAPSPKMLEHLKEMTKKAQEPSAQIKRQETLRAIKHQQGENNNQFGTMWITNGIDNKKIRKEETIPEGWYKGRIIKTNKGDDL